MRSVERAPRPVLRPASARSRPRRRAPPATSRARRRSSMPASANQALTPSGTTKSGGPPGCAASALHARRVEMVVVVVRDRRTASMCGSSASGEPRRHVRASGRRSRRGDARSEKIGSVRTLMPPTCTSTLAWPIQVTAGSIAAPATALRAQEVEVGRRRAASRAAAARAAGRRAPRRCFHFRSAPMPLRLRSRCSCSGSGRRGDAARAGVAAAAATREAATTATALTARRQQGEQRGRSAAMMACARASKHRRIIALPTPGWVGDGWVCTYNLGLC